MGVETLKALRLAASAHGDGATADLLKEAADLIERQAKALMEVSKAGHLFKAHDIARAVLREG